jgi:hypothetical protein
MQIRREIVMTALRLFVLLACLVLAGPALAECPEGQVDCGGGLCCSP